MSSHRKDLNKGSSPITLLALDPGVNELGEKCFLFKLIEPDGTFYALGKIKGKSEDYRHTLAGIGEMQAFTLYRGLQRYAPIQEAFPDMLPFLDPAEIASMTVEVQPAP